MSENVEQTLTTPTAPETFSSKDLKVPDSLIPPIFWLMAEPKSPKVDDVFSTALFTAAEDFSYLHHAHTYVHTPRNLGWYI